MSRYERSSPDNPDYKLILGYDPQLATFFAQVLRKGSPRPVLWLGAAEIISDIESLQASLTPYGGIPIPVCADLLRDQAIDLDSPLPDTLTALIALTRKEPREVAETPLDETLTYYLFVDQSGCHVREWATLPPSYEDRDQALREMVYGEQDPLPEYLETVTGYFRTSSLVLLVHEYGASKHLPLFTALPRQGRAYPGPVGPVVITYFDEGMSAAQVRRVLDEELFVLDETIQKQATELYYRSPLSRLNIF